MKILKIADVELQASENNTLPTAEVAKFYGVDDSAIRKHLQNHQDELIENQHYIVEVSLKGTKKLLWTLEGVYMLGFFIKSERAKKYRKAVAKLLKEIKQGNVQVVKSEYLQKLQEVIKEIEEKSKLIDEYKNKYLYQLELTNRLLLEKLESSKRVSFSDEEIRKIKELYKLGLTPAEIARKINRKRASVASKIRALKERGLI